MLDWHDELIHDVWMRPLAALAGPAAVAIAVAAPAQAATVSVTQLPERPAYNANVLTYRAAPGELNLVRLVPRRESIGGDMRILVSDAAAPVTAGPGCTPVDAHTADCRSPAPPTPGAPFPLDSDVRLGDGDDLAEVAVGGFEADGRFDFWGDEGNDRLLIPSYLYFRGDLQGGPGNDVLHGFGNSHVLDGGPGADEIVGGSGSEILRDGDPDGAPALDTIDGGGGSGVDTLDYTSRIRPVRVDLVAGVGGEPGEGDRLAGVENVRGGRGNDVLLGSPQSNALDGGGGIDLVVGRRGDDALTVGAGRASAGRGNDTLNLRGTAKVSCGPGRNDLVQEVVRPIIGPELARDCELLVHNPQSGSDTPTGMSVDPRAQVKGRVIRLHVTCGDCAEGLMSVTGARRPFRALARRRFRLHRRQDDYAGSAVVALPTEVARHARGRLLRFVMQGRAVGEDTSDSWTYRAAWTIRVAGGYPP